MTIKMTSYERVYNLLTKTSTYNEAVASALQSLKDVTIEKVDFILQSSEDTSKATPLFRFTSGFGWHGNDVNASEVHARHFLTKEMIMKVIDIHYGSDKDVKTFNCKKSIVTSGGTVSRKNRWGEREQQHQYDFEDHCTVAFREMAKDEMKATTVRLRDEIARMTDTDEFKKARREALIGFCKQTLVRALLPWQEMEQSVLEEAWDQFICTTIMRN